MNKQDLIDVYNNTTKIFDSQPRISSSTKKYYTKDILPIERGDKECTVETVENDTVSTAREATRFGQRVGVLNMASAAVAGGGVRNGARAQEECLFRCSNLYSTVVQDFYPLKPDETLYSEGVQFIKDKDYNIIPGFTVDVCTIPALNLNQSAKYDDLSLVDNYEHITRLKIRLMLNLSYQNGCDTLVLGAFGCGVFKNDPLTMAKFFSDELKPYLSVFDFVYFAIINDHNSVGNNYSIFKSVLG